MSLLKTIVIFIFFIRIIICRFLSFVLSFLRFLSFSLSLPGFFRLGNLLWPFPPVGSPFIALLANRHTSGSTVAFLVI